MVDFNNTGSFNFDKLKYMKQKCSIKIATRIMIHNFEMRYLRIVYANVYNGKYYKIKKVSNFSTRSYLTVILLGLHTSNNRDE